MIKIDFTHICRFTYIDVPVGVIVQFLVQRLNGLHFGAVRIVDVTRSVRVYGTAAAWLK